MLLKLDEIFDKVLKPEENMDINSSVPIWEEEPVGIAEFISSPEHIKFPVLSERQLDVFMFMLGDDPKKIFENENWLAILCWGKGCVGKETVLKDAFTNINYTIEDLIKLNKEIYINCVNDKNQQTIEKASVPWKSGSGEMFWVETEFGNKIRVFKHHKFLTKNGWKELSQLNIGDEILDDYVSEKEQKIKLLKEKYSWKGLPLHSKERGRLMGLYFKEYNSILSKEDKQKYGSQKENHPLWGKHQSKESKLKNSLSNKKTFQKIYAPGNKQGEELRKKISLALSGKNNPMYCKSAPKGSGKCKYYKIKNLNGQEFLLQGSWEVKFAEFLNNNLIKWEKNKKRYKYNYNGVERTYLPDFRLFFNDEEIIVEIKGYSIKEEVEAKINAVINAGEKIYLIDDITFKKYYLKQSNKQLRWDKIKSITFDKIDDYYDLEVSKYKNYLSNNLYHHNSGKDSVANICTCYVVYVLLCCKNPWTLFKGIDSLSTIDIINVAPEAGTSQMVFFNKLCTTVKNWKWLNDKYKIVSSGKSKKLEIKYLTGDVVNITADTIRFPKNIVAITSSSEHESAEGRNTLVYILDEFDVFSNGKNANANLMFSALSSSSKTRFSNYGKGFVISWPRYEGGPTMQLIDKYKNDPHVYIDIGSTFDIKPKHCFPGEWINWEGIKIPKSFENDFKVDPENSKAKFLCKPPKSGNPWLTEVLKIDNSINYDKIQLFDVSETINETLNGNMIIKKIVSQCYNQPDVTYVITGDIGLSNDRSTLTMWHQEILNTANGSYVKYIQDLMILWKPDKSENKKVDVNNIQNIIEQIVFIYKLPVVGVWFDHYNSAQLLQSINNKGIVAQAYTLTVQDFYDFRVKLYGEQLKFLPIKEQTEEMKKLNNTNTGKPDHPELGHDDMFRANVMAVSALTGFKNSAVISNEDGLFIKKKIGLQSLKAIEETFEGETVKAQLHKSQSFNSDDLLNSIDGINKLDTF